jgi:hypothetical protein
MRQCSVSFINILLLYGLKVAKKENHRVATIASTPDI